jgi:hypothetical protein
MTVDPLALAAIGFLGATLLITFGVFGFVFMKLGKKRGEA